MKETSSGARHAEKDMTSYPVDMTSHQTYWSGQQVVEQSVSGSAAYQRAAWSGRRRGRGVARQRSDGDLQPAGSWYPRGEHPAEEHQLTHKHVGEVLTNGTVQCLYLKNNVLSIL